MKKNNPLRNMRYSFLLTLTAIVVACSTVPLTGRKQLLLVSDQEVLALSLQQYKQFIRQAPVVRNTPNDKMVERVGRRIASAVETFFTNNGYEAALQNFAWEFSLVRSKEVNAFCMPGGKIVVYEGLLPITQNETGLAIVLGHEVAHAVAKHANERISQQMAIKYGGAIAGGVIGNNQIAQQIGGMVFGIGAQYGVMLPFARKHEHEADELGLIFMAMAGYNPREAVPFWQRMAMSSSGQKPPEFMSTHPSDANRIKKIKKDLPKALKYYKGAGVQNSTTDKIKTSVKPKSYKKAKTSKKWTF